MSTYEHVPARSVVRKVWPELSAVLHLPTTPPMAPVFQYHYLRTNQYIAKFNKTSHTVGGSSACVWIVMVGIVKHLMRGVVPERISSWHKDAVIGHGRI